jgi:hypothetical protein
VNPIERDDLVHWLAVHIDAQQHEPPGVVATKLARTVLEAVENRDGPQAVLLEADIASLAKRYRRKSPDFPTRYCTRCNAVDPQAAPVVAKYVAQDADGVEWYECGNHPPTDNELQKLRVKLTELDVWLVDNGLVRNPSGATSP